MKITAKNSIGHAVIVLLAIATLVPAATAIAHDADKPTPAVNEFYYRVKWGYFDEFLSLFKKNHYPILLRLQEEGVILDMYAAFPASHAGENDRWDMRFTIVLADPRHTYEWFYGSELVEELYPDQDTFQKEEQRRFSLLEAHMDIPIKIDELDDWDTNPD